MTLEEFKNLNVTVTKSTTFPLDEQDEYFDIFLNEYLPENYDKSLEDMSREEVKGALIAFTYENSDVLEEMLDRWIPEEIEDVQVWKQE